MNNPWDGTRKNQLAESNGRCTLCSSNGYMKDSQVRRKCPKMPTAFDGVFRRNGEHVAGLRFLQSSRSYIISGQANTSGGKFGTREKDVLGTKQACSGPCRLSIVVYRRSWREISLRNTWHFHEELKSEKGRPMESLQDGKSAGTTCGLRGG